ncbi:molybdopterin-dependent oxidoreductase [Kribbella shirazensis]|uniref:Biotin/methionine sulfoxide reductase n=1 Tax=Kribbella shirazensis TaxID=1105143 RepID=A0A7X6A206_9ACTN|nr:molybdopterin-dependent oxidoreductase [Kribbella shirazensis]NIK58503.1 biotin/methionine sulfoxide reductase [Kribbella shirazensis]
MSQGLISSSHWGPLRATVSDGRLSVASHELDPDPSPIARNLIAANGHRSRVLFPMVRRGWLDGGPGPDAARGEDEFVRVSWSTLYSVLGDELRRVIDAYGNSAVFGGSYGWGSAGRFHHPQSQVHRFLNQLGGYTRSVNTYSTGASSVILPHVLGADVDAVHGLTSWDVIDRHTTMIVAFGGLPVKNLQVAPGGITQHRSAERLRRIVADGTKVVAISPVRDDCPPGPGVEWLAISPGTDVALMLALAWVLVDENLHDVEFLRTRCAGYDEFEQYVTGRSDGVPKRPEWAETVTGVPAERIVILAREMAAHRTLVTVTWSLQRARHGEQPPWAGIALAAMLGQIGLPGGGFGHGYGSMGDVGVPQRGLRLPTLPQGINPVTSVIPVARVADMLLDPGGRYEYDGTVAAYPDIRLVYWCGGNPFHHHQDLSRLRRAMARPDTVVVHETHWTATAKHADVVVPAATFLERSDIGASRNDSAIVAMRRILPPPGEARTDYQTFAELADVLGVRAAYTENRTEAEWLRHLYETWTATQTADLPDFDAFWGAGHLLLPSVEPEQVMLAAFARDPTGAPLSTPTGRIELTSEVVRSFGYDDCPAHPVYFALEQNAAYPLTLVTTQPARRLHSQLDMGAHSQDGKVDGREPLTMHPGDAARRGIADGSVVLISSAQGRCLASARLTDAITSGCVQLATGAWYDPMDPADPHSPCAHGNPNALTRDEGTSRLAQACTGQLVGVQVEAWRGPVPPITAYEPPSFTDIHRQETRP